MLATTNGWQTGAATLGMVAVVAGVAVAVEAAARSTAVRAGRSDGLIPGGAAAAVAIIVKASSPLLRVELAVSVAAIVAAIATASVAVASVTVSAAAAAAPSMFAMVVGTVDRNSRVAFS